VDNNWKVKICDFGFARAADPKEYMTLCGTDEWMVWLPKLLFYVTM